MEDYNLKCVNTLFLATCCRPECKVSFLNKSKGQESKFLHCEKCNNSTYCSKSCQDSDTVRHGRKCLVSEEAKLGIARLSEFTKKVMTDLNFSKMFYNNLVYLLGSKQDKLAVFVINECFEDDQSQMIDLEELPIAVSIIGIQEGKEYWGDYIKDLSYLKNKYLAVLLHNSSDPNSVRSIPLIMEIEFFKF